MLKASNILRYWSAFTKALEQKDAKRLLPQSTYNSCTGNAPGAYKKHDYRPPLIHWRLNEYPIGFYVSVVYFFIFQTCSQSVLGLLRWQTLIILMNQRLIKAAAH